MSRTARVVLLVSLAICGAGGLACAGLLGGVLHMTGNGPQYPVNRAFSPDCEAALSVVDDRDGGVAAAIEAWMKAEGVRRGEPVTDQKAQQAVAGVLLMMPRELGWCMAGSESWRGAINPHRFGRSWSMLFGDQGESVDIDGTTLQQLDWGLGGFVDGTLLVASDEEQARRLVADLLSDEEQADAEALRDRMQALHLGNDVVVHIHALEGATLNVIDLRDDGSAAGRFESADGDLGGEALMAVCERATASMSASQASCALRPDGRAAEVEVVSVADWMQAAGD